MKQYREKFEREVEDEKLNGVKNLFTEGQAEEEKFADLEDYSDIPVDFERFFPTGVQKEGQEATTSASINWPLLVLLCSLLITVFLYSYDNSTKPY